MAIRIGIDNTLVDYAALGCAFFVDDLAEILLDPAFSTATRPLWFAPGHRAPHDGLEPFATWDAITEACGV